MPTTITKEGKEARAALLSGITKLNNAVRTTLGPAGRTVLFRVPGALIPTKDGVTVAKEINLPDPFESQGADVAKSVADQSVNQAGDGTTTSTLLMQAIFEAGVRAIDVGNYEPNRLAAGMRHASKVIVGSYDEKKKAFSGGILEQFKVVADDDLAFHVAKISANGDEEIARVVADAVLKVGVEGEITIGNARSDKHQLETVEGVFFDSGFIHPALVNDPKFNRTVYENCLVLVLDRRLSTQQETLAIVNKAIDYAAEGDNPDPFCLLIVANDVDTEAMNFIVGNKVKNNVPVVAVTSPSWGPARRDVLEDIALITGGQRIDTAKGDSYEKLSKSSFGKAERVVVMQNKTIITGLPMDEYDRKNKYEPYVAQVRAITENVELHPSDLVRAKQRLAYLAGGIAMIKVGGSSGGEVKERGFRVEDAIHATRAAVADGVVPGGGSALLFAREVFLDSTPEYMQEEDVSDFDKGIQIVLSALEKPIAQIVSNAGHDPKEVIKGVLDKTEGCTYVNGFDAKEGEYIDDMIKAGIVDPLKVVRSSVQASVSAAAMLLLTEVVIANAPDTPMNPGR